MWQSLVHMTVLCILTENLEGTGQQIRWHHPNQIDLVFLRASPPPQAPRNIAKYGAGTYL